MHIIKNCFGKIIFKGVKLAGADLTRQADEGGA